MRLTSSRPHEPQSPHEHRRTSHPLSWARFLAEHGATFQRAAVRSPDDRTIHTNTVELAFSIYKRGMEGLYQHCGEQHLQCYLAEFKFR
jgi:hypothetical protein